MGVKAAGRMSINTAEQQVQDVKNAQKKRELFVLFFFLVISPSSPATIHRGWDEKS